VASRKAKTHGHSQPYTSESRTPLGFATGRPRLLSCSWTLSRPSIEPALPIVDDPIRAGGGSFRGVRHISAWHQDPRHALHSPHLPRICCAMRISAKVSRNSPR
jgi:hypothetical protein